MAKDSKGGKDAGGRDPKDQKKLEAAHDDVHESLEDLHKQVQQMDSLLSAALKQSSDLGKNLDADQKEQLKRWKIMQDMQTKIFQVQQDITANKQKAADKAFKTMDQYIRS